MLPLAPVILERQSIRLYSAPAETSLICFSMSSTIIRHAMESDAAELARLTSQLGYPVSETSIRSRMDRMFSSNDCLLVAERPYGEVVGWIHGFQCQLLESDYRVEIGGLIVDERYRRIGIGQRLVQAIEIWAAERGAIELSVRCQEARAESHKFYENLSFRYIKKQRVFRKRV
jgi:GNAT superfamily N-acetyltransferase